MNLFKNQKGIALPTVIMVVLVLSILSIALLSVSLANVRLSIHDSNRIQSYDLARAGVEMAVRRLKVETDTNIYSDIEELIAFMTSFNNTNITNMPSSSYDVQYLTTGFVEEETVKILGTGVYNGVTETAALVLKVSSPYLNPKGWINNGWIVNDGLFSKTDGVIVFRTKKNIGHAVKKVGDTAAPTTFTAKSLHFMDTAEDVSLEIVTNRSFTLEANLISFVTQVQVPGDESGYLFLDVLSGGDGLVDPTTSLPFKTGYGVIYMPDGLVKRQGNTFTPIFPGGYYYFKGNTAIPGSELNLDRSADRVDPKLIEITDPAVIKKIEDMIKDETRIKIRYDESIWSDN